MKKREGELRLLGTVLEKVLTYGSMAKTLKQASLREAWKETVGPALAERTYPVYLRRGVLLVAATSSVWTQELLFKKDLFLISLREKLKRELIQDIRFKVDVLPIREEKKGATQTNGKKQRE